MEIFRKTILKNRFYSHLCIRTRFCANPENMNEMSDKQGSGGGYLGGSGWRSNSRIRSVPGNNTLPRTISAMMQPTDQTSTENEMITTTLACRTQNGKNENTRTGRGCWSDAPWEKKTIEVHAGDCFLQNETC